MNDIMILVLHTVHYLHFHPSTRISSPLPLSLNTHEAPSPPPHIPRPPHHASCTCSHAPIHIPIPLLSPSPALHPHSLPVGVHITNSTFDDHSTKREATHLTKIYTSPQTHKRSHQHTNRWKTPVRKKKEN
ncbi:hypothetical protein K458DRAFT_52561 [Lentithecium fluviatile CBS 122367]|uniref:Uncharacterized protein n=1 Tax=Lentithecium fluviatile CBS 122367 TaxID=1168545 RepID=A0A6G1IWI9_9PLEO|nr:hypothetical protein K458DRAFT_52561 [Lentithecium fluviatile CBS 122367]